MLEIIEVTPKEDQKITTNILQGIMMEIPILILMVSTMTLSRISLEATWDIVQMRVMAINIIQEVVISKETIV